MPRLLRRLRHHRGGATAAEFALTLPLMILILVAFLQVGMYLHANAGLQNALGEGARVATLWPRRTPGEIAETIRASGFGLNPERFGAPVFTFGNAGGQDFVDIRVTYTPRLNFLFFEVPGITLERERRAYLP
ncbi:MAG: TadE/TadG family type IV pilus assembly protein [Sphingomonadaceae bacterium]